MGSGLVRLAASELHKSFAGVPALRGVSFDVRAGEVHALVGENGAGKSTLVRLLTGVEIPDRGALDVAGVRLAVLSPAEARRCGIAAIHQHPALFADLSVAENIALVLERGGPFSRVDWRQRDRRARALLDRIGASIDPSRLARTLTLPEQQLVEIAKALGAEARVILMDEPTASLAAREVDRLFAVIARLKADGVGMLYISHRLDEIPRIADRISVLRDGVTVATDLPPDLDVRALVRLMVGRDGVAAASTIGRVRSARPADAAPALSLRRVSSRAAGVREVSFDVARGEIVGLAGLVGAGRTELAEALFGLRPIDDGEVRRDGVVVHAASPAEAIAAGIAYLPEDRRRHGVLGEMSVAANTSLASLRALARRGLIDRRAEASLARRFVDRLAIKTPALGAPVGTLSGGNQQKVALARWLATAPSLLILDEPTQGVDVRAKAEIHALIRQLVDEGLAVLLISSELPEVLALSDRVVVMRRGRVAGVLDRADASEQAVAALAIVHDADAGTRAS